MFQGTNGGGPTWWRAAAGEEVYATVIALSIKAAAALRGLPTVERKDAKHRGLPF